MWIGKQLTFAGKPSMLARDREGADHSRETLAHERLSPDHKRLAFVRGRSMSGCRLSIGDFDRRMDDERPSGTFAHSPLSTCVLSSDGVLEHGNFATCKSLVGELYRGEGGQNDAFRPVAGVSKQRSSAERTPSLLDHLGELRVEAHCLVHLGEPFSRVRLSRARRS